MNNRQAIKEIALEYLNKFGLDVRGWTYKEHIERKSWLGACNYNTRTISLHPEHLELNTFEQCLDTLMHEFAHALTPGHGHGKEWRKMAVKLGANPRATSKVKSLPTVYKYEICAKMPDGTILRSKIFRNRRTDLSGRWLKSNRATENRLFYDEIK